MLTKLKQFLVYKTIRMCETNAYDMHHSHVYRVTQTDKIPISIRRWMSISSELLIGIYGNKEILMCFVL